MISASQAWLFAVGHVPATSSSATRSRIARNSVTQEKVSISWSRSLHSFDRVGIRLARALEPWNINYRSRLLAAIWRPVDQTIIGEDQINAGLTQSALQFTIQFHDILLSATLDCPTRYPRTFGNGPFTTAHCSLFLTTKYLLLFFFPGKGF